MAAVVHDVYVCACVPVTHGGSTVRRQDDVELTVPPPWNVSAARGVRVRRRVLPPQSVTVRGRVRPTTALPTALDLGRTLPVDDAVVLPDRLVVDGGAASRVRRRRGCACCSTGRRCSPGRWSSTSSGTAEDLADPARLVARIAAALARAH